MNKILCLSPHSDDIEFSMSGFILSEENTEFDIILFSTASELDKTKDEDRYLEMQNFWKNKDSKVNIIFLKECLNSYSEEKWIVDIEKRINIKDYLSIFMPPLEDSHYEHRMVHNIGIALTRNNPISAYEYHTPSTLPAWCPNYFYEISDEVFYLKTASLDEFKSQNKIYFKQDYLNSFHTDPFTQRKGIKYVEKFRSIFHINSLKD